MYFILLLLHSTLLLQGLCHGLDLHYDHKIVGNVKGDQFGWSLGAAKHKLVIAAPQNEKGSLMVVDTVTMVKVIVKSPFEIQEFNDLILAVNSNYIVVGRTSRETDSSIVSIHSI